VDADRLTDADVARITGVPIKATTQLAYSPDDRCFRRASDGTWYELDATNCERAG
jgi:hypothetical protein